MSYYRRLNFLFALLAITGGAVPPAGAIGSALVVSAVRYSTGDAGTRVVLDLSRRSGFMVDFLPDSSGISLVVPGAELGNSVTDLVVGSGALREIHPRSDSTRVEVLLVVDRGSTWREFSLPAADGKPFRIVLDVARAVGGPRAPASSDVGLAPSDPPMPEVSAPAPRETRPASARPFVVAVDAGHGGHDTGTLGKYGLVEKRLCLDLAKRVATILDRQPGIEAILTRDTDAYLTLTRRNEIAEEKNADVFVSIHLNSAPSGSARGAEIYFVAPAGAERAANKALASGEAAEGFGLDPGDNGDIVHMLLDVNQQSVLARSELLAESILESVRDRKLLPTRAVKQKSFSVLRTISMPSVLVEAGFISNASDAKLVRDADGRERIARAIADGVIEFSRVHPPQRTEGDEQPVVHRVQRGDTLWTISRLYNTTVERLRQINRLGAKSSLQVGQELVVRTN